MPDFSKTNKEFFLKVYLTSSWDLETWNFSVSQK